MPTSPRLDTPAPRIPPRPTPRPHVPRSNVPKVRAEEPRPSGKPDRILCLDIETVPDEALLPQDWKSETFPKPIWHEVVAISFVEAAIQVDAATGHETYLALQCRSGGEPDWDERRLLRSFWKFFASGHYRLVTWNGRGFDVPVLLLRAMMYGIPAAAYFTRGDRWSGYGQRYSAEWHADLLELTSGHGASMRMGLDDVARAIGLPGKGGEHGSKVSEMIGRGEIERVRSYCETDCLNTAGAFYRYMYLCGRSDAAGHDASMGSLLDLMQAQRGQRPHLGAFVDRWKASTRPVSMMIAG